MNKKLYWKVHEFIDDQGDMDFLFWFEALSFIYARNPHEVDEIASCFKFFVKEE